MRLVVKQSNKVVSDLQFAGGPIHIGRSTESQLFLSHRLVSRHHAVIFKTTDGKWMIEDLDSPNKTFLNGAPIHKKTVKTGDLIKIADFFIEVNLDNHKKVDPDINLQDTLSKTAFGLEDTVAAVSTTQQMIVRKTGSGNAPDIKMPAIRVRDFIKATEAICKTNGQDELIAALLSIALRQFDASAVWCALRIQAYGPMTNHAGKCKDGVNLELEEIHLKEKITEAVEKNQFLLFPRIVQRRPAKKKTGSAMIAPLLGQGGSFGVLYVENDPAHQHYTLSDLDYLMFIAIHTSVVVENF
jgi:pSer/pThr/pTyr-binding forkhead associated (FHA) protein